MKYYKKLLGEKVYLSPMNSEDVEKFTTWMNDFNVTDYIARSSMLVTNEGEKRWINSVVEGNTYLFAIVKNEDDKLIGNIELIKTDFINRKATLGIMIGESDERSKGYGCEAIKLLVDFAFNYLNLESINLTVLDFNERAKKCYTKAGFKESGRHRKSRFINGKYYDAIYMDLLKEEFNGNFIKNKNI